MSGEIHKDKGRLFIGNLQGFLEALGLSSSDVVLDFSVAYGSHKSLRQKCVASVFDIRIGQIVEHSQASVQPLDGLIGQSLYDSAGVIGHSFEMSDGVPEGLDLRN